MDKKYKKTQQNKEDYEKYLLPNWENEKVFSSYYKQIELVKKYLSNGGKILEIGPGTGFVTDYLRKLGYKVDTFDYFEKFNPTYNGDIRDIDNLVKGDYDLIICFEVLEHIPFKDFIPTLEKFYKISNNIIISLPRPTINIFRFLFRFPYMNKYFKISLNISYFWKEHKYKGDHYWEIGKKGYSHKNILNKIRNNFLNSYFLGTPLLHENHYFYKISK